MQAASVSEKLNSFLDHRTPSEISEIIAPDVHGKEESGSAAVIKKYFQEETGDEQQDEPQTELTEKLRRKKRQLKILQNLLL